MSDVTAVAARDVRAGDVILHRGDPVTVTRAVSAGDASRPEITIDYTEGSRSGRLVLAPGDLVDRVTATGGTP